MKTWQFVIVICAYAFSSVACLAEPQTNNPACEKVIDAISGQEGIKYVGSSHSGVTFNYRVMSSGGKISIECSSLVNSSIDFEIHAVPPPKTFLIMVSKVSSFLTGASESHMRIIVNKCLERIKKNIDTLPGVDDDKFNVTCPYPTSDTFISVILK
jgi:hypothetical protein